MENQTSNRRIAKNTLFLYIRMIIIMLMGLYTSRIVLEELGITDYGVYNVTGGVVAMFAFLNSCMITSTQRYLNYEMGCGGEYSLRLKQIFSTSLTIHLLIAGVILILAETVGLWFVNYKLVIPEASRFGANVAYQLSIAAFVINILRVPFNASIIAHERMNLFAIIGIVDAALLLGVAFLLMEVHSYKLAWYSVFRFFPVLILSAITTAICLKKFKECSLKCSYIPSLFKEMLGFASWNMFGSVAWLVRNQGMGIMLNLFFGPAINAAKGIADQVSTAVNSLTGNFQTALNPQITKSYASDKISEMETLTFRGVKFSCMLVWFIALPIIMNVSTLLALWLTDVPGYAAIFIVLILMDCFTSCLFGNPLMTSLSATGKIRNYQIIVSLVLILILPAAYFALKAGMAPESIFYLNILFNLLAGIVRFEFCRRQIGYSFKSYLSYAFAPVIAVLILSTAVPVALKYLLLNHIHIGSIHEMLILQFISFVSVAAFSWVIGLTKNERETMLKLIVAKLHHS